MPVLPQIPCYFPAYQGIWRRDGFAKDWPHRQPKGVRPGHIALNAEEFLAAADFAADGVMFTAEADATRFSAAQALDAAFQAAAITPTDTTIRTYAAVRLWAEAAAKAVSIEGEKVAAALRAASWNTVLGSIAFDGKGDPVGPQYAVYIVSGGKIGELKN